MKYGFLASIMAIFVGFSGITGCAPETTSSSNEVKSSSETVIIGANRAGKPITVQKGQIIELRLQGNATTGYEWIETSLDAFSESPQVLERMGSTYQPDQTNTKQVGSGGTYIRKYKAVGKGRARITMQYLRPWEGQTAQTEKLTFDITVN